MKIDEDVEPLVREALARSVSEEPEKFENALEAIAINDDVAVRSVSLALAIGSSALWTAHEGRRPEDPRLRSLAHTFARTQAWSNLDDATALAFLTALADGKSPIEVLRPGDVALAAFAIGGWLLSGFLPDDGTNWNDLLDAILDKLESTPDRSIAHLP